MASRPGTYGATSHRGRERDNAFNYDRHGPAKGYSRPDERIREDISECMINDTLLDAAEIEVQVREGEVTLTGAVADQGNSRRAQDLAEQVHGVRNVRNGLRIRQHGIGTTRNASSAGA